MSELDPQTLGDAVAERVIERLGLDRAVAGVAGVSFLCQFCQRFFVVSEPINAYTLGTVALVYVNHMSAHGAWSGLLHVKLEIRPKEPR